MNEEIEKEEENNSDLALEMDHISFFLDTNGKIYVYVHLLDLDEDTQKRFGIFLNILNTGQLTPDIISVLGSIVKNDPSKEEAIKNLMTIWRNQLLETNSKSSVDDEGELVVRPTEFIKYPGFAGNR